MTRIAAAIAALLLLPAVLAQTEQNVFHIGVETVLTVLLALVVAIIVIVYLIFRRFVKKRRETRNIVGE
jgi:hypothetical protein